VSRTEDAEALARGVLCEREDHRRCRHCECEHAAYWWPLVLEVGTAALVDRERRYAVVCLVPVCLVDGMPRVVLCTDTATAATSARNSHYRGHDGYERRGVPSVHGWMALVDAVDGPRIR
jgi:hypothetical protein